MLCNGSSSPSVLEEETDFPASTIKSSYNINQGWSRKQLLVKCFARVIKGSEARGTEWYVQAKQWDWCTSLNSHWLDHKCNPFMHVSKESSFQLERHVEGFFFFNFWQLNIIKNTSSSVAVRSHSCVASRSSCLLEIYLFQLRWHRVWLMWNDITEFGIATRTCLDKCNTRFWCHMNSFQKRVGSTPSSLCSLGILLSLSLPCSLSVIF